MMNNQGKTTIYIGVLIMVILSASIYMVLPDKAKIVVENTNTKFSVWENESWTLAATEYVYIYDGTKKMRASSREVTNYTVGNITYIIRNAIWKDNITTIDTYTFDSTTDDITLFPIDHKVQILNAENKILQFEYRDILYEGPTKVINNPFSFGHNMKLEWDDSAYYHKVFQQKVASDKIIVKYRITSDDFTVNVRVFDPPTINCYQETANISTICGGLATGSYNYTGTWSVSFPASNVFDGNKLTGGWDSGPTGGYAYLYVNYTKPDNATSAIWEITDGDSGTQYTNNVSIPDICFSDIIQFEIISKSTASPSDTVTWSCWNTSAWQLLRTTPDSDRGAFEEGVYWNLTHATNFTLDGLNESRVYEWQTYINVSAFDNSLNFCLSIDYPGYGINYTCTTTGLINLFFLLDDPSVTTFSDGSSDYDYNFPYYSWLNNSVEIDSQFNMSSATFSLSGSISDIIISQFDDWDVLEVEKSYFVANDTSTIINMSIDGDVTLIGANFVVSAPSGSNITNLTIDMFSDGVVDYTYDETIDEFVNDLVVINITLVNNFLSGNFKVVNFSLDADLNGTVLIKSVFFVKSAATYPLDVEIDIGYDGASDAEYKGSMIGSTLFVDSNTDGESSKVFTCEDSKCSYNMSFELNKVQTYDNCYMYFEGSGLNSRFVEYFTSTTYEESNTLSTSTYFGQIQMSGSSGSYSNGQYVSTLISNLSEDIEYLTLTASDQIDSGADITYYVSIDNGSSWFETTNGIPYHFESAGHQPKFKFEMTTNVARVANAYVTDVTIEDIGSYSDLIEVIINDTTYAYNHTFDSSLGLFKANFGCDEVNELLVAATTLTYEIPLIINITNPGVISSTQYYFGGELTTVDLGIEVIKKHQINEQTAFTSVNATGDSSINDTVFNLTMDYPEYSVSDDIFINITGSYWR